MSLLRTLLPSAALLFSVTATHAQPVSITPQKQSPEEAACIAGARGLVPEGTNVTNTSIAFAHSVTPIAADTFHVYVVMIDAETAGQRLQYRYTCREWRGSIDIRPAAD